MKIHISRITKRWKRLAYNWYSYKENHQKDILLMKRILRVVDELCRCKYSDIKLWLRSICWDIDEFFFRVAYSTKIQCISFLSIEEFVSKYLSADWYINTVSVSSILTTPFINSSLSSFFKLSRRYFLSSDQHTYSSCNLYKIFITRRVQSNTCSFETSQKTIAWRYALKLSECFSLYKVKRSCAFNNVWEILNLLWKMRSFLINSTTLRKLNLIIRANNRKRSSKKVKSIFCLIFDL